MTVIPITHARPASSKSSLVEELRPYGGVCPRFQPLVAVSRVRLGGCPYQVVGLECLTRGPAASGLESATDLFAEACCRGETVHLDRFCLSAALQAAGRFRTAIRGLDLFLNVHASTVESDRDLAHYLERRLARSDLSTARVVVELVESEPVADTAAFQVGVQRLRKTGVRLALDDFGQGYANDRLFLTLRPEFLKVSRFITWGAPSDVYRRALIASSHHLATELGIRLVAEGVETDLQLATLQTIGIGLAQGHLFAPPLPIEEVACRIELRTGRSMLREPPLEEAPR